MGYIRHDAVIAVVSGYVFDNHGDAPAPDVEGFRQSLPEDWQRLVIGPVQSLTNGDVYFIFLSCSPGPMTTAAHLSMLSGLLSPGAAISLVQMASQPAWIQN